MRGIHLNAVMCLQIVQIGRIDTLGRVAGRRRAADGVLELAAAFLGSVRR